MAEAASSLDSARVSTATTPNSSVANPERGPAVNREEGAAPTGKPDAAHLSQVWARRDSRTRPVSDVGSRGAARSATPEAKCC
eukprot:6960199-Alexandrium_andersonii.AAC.1